MSKYFLMPDKFYFPNHLLKHVFWNFADTYDSQVPNYQLKTTIFTINNENCIKFSALKGGVDHIG